MKYHQVGVTITELPMMRYSVLSAFSFNLLFFIQRETCLNWFRGRHVSGMVKETQICVSSADM